MGALALLLWIVAVALAVPALVLLVECLAAQLPGRRVRAGATRLPLAVLIPAHDEEAMIGATITALRGQLVSGDRLIVIADNCGDGTAAVARAAGAEAIERTDVERRGKGFAIAFGLAHLEAAPPGAVVILDADCRLSEGGLELLVHSAAASGRPVQAEYLLAAPERPTPLAVVSALALIVRNRVRPLGLHRLGLPCQLTGSGMAFPWPVIRGAPAMGDDLVEDLGMGIELALQGTPPLSCPEARVTSELPERNADAARQRRRWEHGQLATLLRQGPRLLAAGITRGRAGLVAMALDLMVPPLALLVMLLCAALGAAVVAALAGAARGPAWALAGALGAVAVAVLASWARFARHAVPLRYALVVPFYVLWKIPLYLALAVKGKHRRWERTRRKGE